MKLLCIVDPVREELTISASPTTGFSDYGIVGLLYELSLLGYFWGEVVLLLSLLGERWSCYGLSFSGYLHYSHDSSSCSLNGIESILFFFSSRLLPPGYGPV